MRLIAILAICAVLMGCYERNPERTEKTANGYTVETLLTHDGITVYRFYDGIYCVYFASKGSVEWSQMSGKVSRPVRVDTVEHE